MGPKYRRPDARSWTQEVGDLSFSVTGSDRFYMTWQAIANLAEMAGDLDITVYAESGLVR